jgi:hypothetical protein
MNRFAAARSAGFNAATEPGRSAFAAGIVLTGLLSVIHAARILAATAGTDVIATLACVGLGILLADFASGLLHWACDTWGNEDSRWFGSSLIHSFREHHRSPTAMLKHDWVEVNGEAGAAAAGIFGILLVAGPAAWLQQHPGIYALVWVTVSVAAISNQLHQWAHSPAPPRPVRALQRAGLILSMRRHAPHHRAPCVKRYCISTGWLNPSLDAIGFWRGLERAIERSTHNVPRAEDPTGI